MFIYYHEYKTGLKSYIYSGDIHIKIENAFIRFSQANSGAVVPGNN